MHVNEERIDMTNVIDLFAGAGGLSLGAARAGFNVIGAVEIDSHAIESHRINFPNTCHIQHDVMKINGEELLERIGVQAKEIVGVIGGPPCQGFSSIGRGNVDDIRNKLFERFFELVNELKPAFFVAENVPGIMNSKYDKIRKSAFEHVKEYHILDPVKVNAAEYGAPTTRTRYFFVGYRKNDPRITEIVSEDLERMKVQVTDITTVRKALEGLPSNIEYHENCDGMRSLDENYSKKNLHHEQSDFFYRRVTGMRPEGLGDPVYVSNYEQHKMVNGCLPTKHTDLVSHRYSRLAYGQRDSISKSVRLNPDSFCPTLRSGTGPEKGSYQAVRPIHYQYARVITPREAARLQGFPDWYKLPNTIWHSFRQIGNSVSPIAAEQILRAIHQKLT